MSAAFRIAALIAFRNLGTHRVTTLIVGSIIVFGTALVVTGSALLDSVEAAMERSITSSLAGHLQVYSGAGRDELALFGSGFFATDDIGEIRDSGAVRQAISSVDNVDSVVPMGLLLAQVVRGNRVDGLVAAARKALAADDDEATTVSIGALRGVVTELRRDYENRLLVSDDPDETRRKLADLRRAADPEFFTGSAEQLEEALLWISMNIAPLYQEGRLLIFRMLGTDPDLFEEKFDRFRVVRGQPIPQGRRGLLLSERNYEDFIKHRAARWLDQLEKSSKFDRSLLETDGKLKDKVRRLPRQASRLLLDLDDGERGEVLAALNRELGARFDSTEAALEELLSVSSENFVARREAFYAHVAPRIELYSIKVGESVTLRAYTRSGYLRSANVKLYGVFRFEGLEGSDLSGAQNILDLATFRELYGVMTAAKRAELDELRAELALEDVAADDAEAALFGASDDLVVDQPPPESADAVALEVERSAALDETIAPGAFDTGLALNLAVILKDSSKLSESKGAIESALAENGYSLKVVDWHSAAGMVGQFVSVVRLVLYVAIAIIFLVAVVIINNSMVMATMERVAEIGTMRAMGSQRRFIMLLFLLETLLLGVFAGSAGAGLGALVIALLGEIGIPATSDVLVFLFSGERLFPTLAPIHLVVGMSSILLVSIVSTLYPARIATLIQPATAMRGKD